MQESKISILHIASDEKFINAANYIFEKAFPDCNHFIIPRSRFNRNLTYTEIKKNVEVVHNGNGLVQMLLKIIQKYDCIVLHGITELNSNIFLSSHEKNKFIGILWGAELYTKENFPERSFLGEITAAIKLPEPGYSLNERVKDIIRKIVYKKPLTIIGAAKSAALCLSYFCVPYEEEFEYFKVRNLISEDCRHISFTYYPLEYIMKGNELAIVNGNDILLGNSASLTNNHLEAFQLLKSIDIGNRKIIVPLSYGNVLYADHIQAKGIDLFNKSFKPLRKFMSLDEYTKELLGCGIVIMNHFRQQAVGNVLAMLWLGSKVYLNESNTLFHYLKRIGIKIYSVEKDLTKENQSALLNLSKYEIEQNRIILKKIIGEKCVIEKLKEGIFKYFS